jgi:peptidoglycan/xylan/chitin deacetylase (PgdA/CDA1 family)
LSDLVAALERRDWSGIPRNALVITFDDGFRRNFALLDLFHAYSLVPTVYVCSQIVATGRRFWFRAVPDPEPLKRLEHSQRLARLRAATGFEPEREHEPAEREALSTEEIRLMRDSVEFASHTRFHPVLTTCTDEDCAAEIEGSRREIEALVGRPCEHFSYPNGDYGGRELALVKRAGYRSARTIDFGWNGPRTDPYHLKILGFSDEASVTRLAADLTGIPGYLGRLVRGRMRGEYRPIVLAPDARARRGGSPSDGA